MRVLPRRRTPSPPIGSPTTVAPAAPRKRLSPMGRRAAPVRAAIAAAPRRCLLPPGRRAALVLAALAALAAGLSAPAAGQAVELGTLAAIKPSFSPDRLGAKAAFTFTVHFT